MNVRVNGEEVVVNDGATVADIVDRVMRRPQHHGVAVALNGEVVSRGDWNQKALDDGDRVEVLGAIAGG